MMGLHYLLAAHTWPDRVAMWLAWRLPRRVAYMATVRVAVETTDEYPGSRTVVEVLGAWDGAS